VIVPTYTFVTTASAFLLRGAKVVFADSEEATPNLDVQAVANLISPRTKAVVPVHYAGISCDMDPLVELCRDAGVLVIEDAAQAVDAYYKGRRLGGIGDMGVFSFHDTKNIQAGEGGLLAIRDPTLAKRAEIHWEKGTNRAAFFRGEIDKYGWVELGSSFLPSELVAAVLFAQLEKLTEIQARRVSVWQRYAEGLAQLSEAGFLELPLIPAYASNNAHMFYVLARTPDERSGLLAHLRDRWISATFHYLPLHSSPYFQSKHDGRPLPRADSYAARILRLPLFYDLRDDEIDRVIEAVRLFFSGRS
jgi:dTDP-4-amino-4,6-dideoxygalactose transaminase